MSDLKMTLEAKSTSVNLGSYFWLEIAKQRAAAGGDLKMFKKPLPA